MMEELDIMRMYSYKAVDDYVSKMIEKDDRIELMVSTGCLVDNYILILPDGYKWKYIMFLEKAINCWESGLIMKKSNDESEFIKIYKEYEFDVEDY